jgi:DNA-binding MarR family transcriptional regulator
MGEGQSDRATDQGLSELELTAWRSFLQAHTRVVRRLDAELIAERGVTLTAYEVLLVLAATPDRALRMSELADRVLLSRSGLTRLVDGLVARGDIERRKCPSDARGALAVLTQTGFDRLRHAAPVHLRGVRRHFTGRLDEGQLQMLGETLAALGDHPSECDGDDALS